MSIEYVALGIAIVSGVLVPLAITGVFPWGLSINSKIAVIVEKLTTLTERIEQAFREHEQMTHTLNKHEKRLDDHEHPMVVIEHELPARDP